jgi:Nucleotidyl transferase
MKSCNFGGGMGTRLAEETQVRPRPMVEIGGRPILWHIMKIYSRYDFNDFIVCLGWHPPFDIERSIGLTLDWYRAFQGGANMRKVTLGQIDEAITTARNLDRVQTGSVQARLSAQP